MSFATLLVLALVGFASGFVDAIAGGGGLLTVPALVLAGLDPVAAVATNKLAGFFGTGSATLAFARAGKIEANMVPAALAAGIGAALGALALPYAPRALLSLALPFVLIAVALYFAFSPGLGEGQRRRRVSPMTYIWTLAPVIGFYDGVFGPGAGSFYLIALVALVGLSLIPAMAAGRLSNLGSNTGSLIIYALAGHIVVPAGLAMGVGAFLGARLGAGSAIRAGAKLVRPLIVIVSCAMALRLIIAPEGPLAFLWK
ncbi:MAG TPA: TSUP family transporter [Roseiarcus sp.]